MQVPVAVYVLLLNKAHRVGALCFSASADTVTAVWNNFLGLNLPPLHSLLIQPYTGADLVLPESFVAIPSLRYLALKGLPQLSVANDSALETLCC